MRKLTSLGQNIERVLIDSQSEPIDISRDLFANTWNDRELAIRLEIMKDLRQPKEHHPEGDVLTHTNKVLNYIHDEWIFEYENPSYYPQLIMAGFLHDFGKIDTFKEENGKITFVGHDKESVKYASYFLGSCGFSYEFTKTVLYLIENHMRIASFIDMGDKKRDKFLKDEHFLELLKLHEADCMSSSGDLKNLKYIRAYMVRKEGKIK